MHPIFQGIILGLTLAVTLGPALFSLLQTSIHRGFWAGARFALGISLSDITVLTFCYFGVSQILRNPENQFVAGIIGGSVLIAYGIYTFLHKTPPIQNNNNNDKDEDINIKIKVPKPITHILKGYILNITNPGVWALWVTAMTGISAGYEAKFSAIFYFFIGTLGTVFSTDILKCFIAHKIKNHLKPKSITGLNKFVGVLLIIFGIIVIITVFLKSTT